MDGRSIDRDLIIDHHCPLPFGFGSFALPVARGAVLAHGNTTSNIVIAVFIHHFVREREGERRGREREREREKR
jgi:hypothetical protein